LAQGLLALARPNSQYDATGPSRWVWREPGAAAGRGEVARIVPGLHCEHRQFLGSVPGKEVGVGSHPDGVVAMRQRFMVWRRWFVNGKPVRWLKAEVEGPCSTGRLRGRGEPWKK
jgi:hypothetical protein